MLSPSDELQLAVSSVKRIATGLDVSVMSGIDAAMLTSLFASLERLGAAGKTMCVRRVEETNAFLSSGDRDAVSFVARSTGVSRGEATSVVATARRLEKLAAAESAFLSGDLSAEQATAVAKGAEAAPEAEQELLSLAQRHSVWKLNEEARRLLSLKSAAAESDRTERQKSRRCCSIRTTDDGMVSIFALLTPEEGSVFKARFQKVRDQIFRKAWSEGRRDRPSQYDADALLAMMNNPTGKTKTYVNVVVDYNSLVRGYRETGETCEIPGIGEISVTSANKMLEDSLLRMIVTDGVEIKSVSSLKRYVPMPLQVALSLRDQTCGVPKCDERVRLETDHQHDHAKGGATHVDNLVRMCPWHHRQKTHHGYRLVGEPGNRRWIGPEQARAG